MHRVESPQPMSNDSAIESAIKAVGADKAPRVTVDDINAAIMSETFTMLPSGKVMVCELTLRNGFTVRGESATVSPANFNEEIGRTISRENARNKVWELEGYRLQENLHNLANGPIHTPEWPEPSGKVLTDADALADLMGTPRPA